MRARDQPPSLRSPRDLSARPPLLFMACSIPSGPPLPGIRFSTQYATARLQTRRSIGGWRKTPCSSPTCLPSRPGCWDARHGIDLGADALPATLAYRVLLQRLDAAPFDAAVTALWVLERVYLLGWASAASSTSPFGEFVEHWTDPAFAGYVDGLGELATPDGHDDLVADVLTHEVAFWDMALT